MFEASTHNERIKHAYGNYGFWSWLRYWYIDSVNYVTMVLIDKGYFDYDFEKVEAPVLWEETVMSDEETENLVAMFGIGHKKSQEEKMQEFIINEENKKQDGRNSGSR